MSEILVSKVLIIDDQPDWRRTLKGVIEDEGISPESITTLEDLNDLPSGLAQWGSALRLVTLDGDLMQYEHKDIYDGIQVIPILRELSPNAKIVAISGGFRKYFGGLEDEYVWKLELEKLPEILKKAGLV